LGLNKEQICKIRVNEKLDIVIKNIDFIKNKTNLFPVGVLYDFEKHRYLIKNVNSYFGLINILSTNYNKNKIGIKQDELELSPLVARTGFELSPPRRK